MFYKIFVSIFYVLHKKATNCFNSLSKESMMTIAHFTNLILEKCSEFNSTYIVFLFLNPIKTCGIFHHERDKLIESFKVL